MKLLGIIISFLVGIALMYLSDFIPVDRLYKGMFVGFVVTSIVFMFCDIDEKLKN